MSQKSAWNSYLAADVSPANPGEPSHWKLREHRRRHIAKMQNQESKPKQRLAKQGETGTIYKKSVVEPQQIKKRKGRLTKSGSYSFKTGKIITKGPWKGREIRTLSLEERATCPSSCHHWRDCYGNNMPWAHRIKHGPEFEAALWDEMAELSRKSPLAIRLHVLGDFYSRDYVRLWGRIVQELDVVAFGYSAHKRTSSIGELLGHYRRGLWHRFAIRLSSDMNYARPKMAITVQSEREAKSRSRGQAIICPAQTGKTANCGTCGLCWNSERPIAFLAH